MGKCYNSKYFGDVMKRKVYIEEYGYKKIEIYDIDDETDFNIVKFIHNNRIYTGLVTSSGEIIISFSTDEIYEIFATKDKKQYCFTFKTDSGFRSYHIEKNDNKYCLKADIYGNDVTSCRLVNTINDNYWFIESNTNNLIEYSLYDPNNAKILTPAFTEISFEEEEGRVLAFVEKDIYKQEDNENYYLGSMLSYIDKNGSFLTPIYVPELDNFYDARCYNNDFNFKAFQTFLQRITIKLDEIYNQKNDYVTDILGNMYSNLYSENELVIEKGLAKVIIFPGGSNEKK